MSDKKCDKRPDRRRARSDAAIREAFARLLAEKDLNKITVKELAECADIDRKTFYLRYESIDDLVDEVLHEEVSRTSAILAQMDLQPDGEIDLKELFEAIGIELLNNLNERAPLLQHVDSESFITKLRPLLSDELAKRNALGLSEDLGPYLPLFVGFFCSGLLNLFNQWMKEDSELPLEELAMLASSAVAGGISSLTHSAKMLGIAKTPNAR